MAGGGDFVRTYMGGWERVGRGVRCVSYCVTLSDWYFLTLCSVIKLTGLFWIVACSRKVF